MSICHCKCLQGLEVIGPCRLMAVPNKTNLGEPLLSGIAQGRMLSNLFETELISLSVQSRYIFSHVREDGLKHAIRHQKTLIRKCLRVLPLDPLSKFLVLGVAVRNHDVPLFCPKLKKVLESKIPLIILVFSYTPLLYLLG
jgi:hypothetical protein